MTAFDSGDTRRIQHLVKVHGFARTIGILEGLDEETQLILEAAALVHDIAILPCEAELGRCDGQVQEQYGPLYARAVLKDLNFDPKVLERVCWLVGHHHTYTGIEEMDHRILVEADFLVNLCEECAGEQAVRQAYERIFRTEAGRALCRELFGL